MDTGILKSVRWWLRSASFYSIENYSDIDNFRYTIVDRGGPIFAIWAIDGEPDNDRFSAVGLGILVVEICCW